MNSIVKTTGGPVRGHLDDGTWVYRGIPYAAPPVGQLRWQPPEPAIPWIDVRDGREPGRASLQAPIEDTGPLSVMLEVIEPQSEDCLYLNVWTPGVEDSRPVMVWIHGGAFSTGSGSQVVYSGQNICRRDVVLVTINYRLGPFGFAHLATPTNGAIPATGNEGLLDQVAALKWVRDNIAAFGGDPGNVTIFGESAGSASVACLMAMPAAKGLFHKAIAQSGGGCHFGHSIEDSVAWFTEPMLEKLGTRAPDDLMRTPAETILQAFPGMTESMMNPLSAGHYAGQVADGKVLPGLPEKAIADGSATGIPLLAGNTRDEMSMLLGMMGKGTFEAPSLDDLATLLGASLPAPLTGEKLVETYRAAREARGARTDAGSIIVAILTNKIEIVPGTRILDAQRAHAPVYCYLFDWMAPFGDGILGAHHGLDVPFTFGTHALDGIGEYVGRGPAADALSNAMMDAWTSFARTGNPSSPGLGDWPEYDEVKRPTMMIGPNVHVAEDPMGEERRAWDDVPTSSPIMKSMLL